MIADPHIYGRPANDERLRDAVRWINEHRDSRRIELVFVLGDVTWRHGQAVRARRILEGLSVPWVPLIGDNEMMEGSEREFHLAFALQYRRLTRSLAGFGWAPTPVVDPATGRAAFLQNFVLDHRGVRFVGLDWVTRSGGDSAEFHDYPGGTWRWFVQSVDGAPSGPDERVVLLSHLPMHFNLVYEVFSREEYRRLAAYLGSRRRSVYADFAGHYHIDWRERKADGAYWLFVTDATFEDVNRLRLVTVTRGEEAFEYEHALIDVPAAPSGSGR